MENIINERNDLIKNYYNYVWDLVYKIGSTNYEIHQDLFQEGVLGLIHAYEYYDPNKGVKFITYATSWIRKYMYGYLYKQTQLTMGETSSVKLQKLKKIIKQYTQDFGYEPSIEELVEISGFKEHVIRPLLYKFVDYEKTADMHSSSNNTKEVLDEMIFNDLIMSADLTEQEHQMLNLILDGYEDKDIKKELGIKRKRYAELREITFEKIRTTAELKNLTLEDLLGVS